MPELAHVCELIVDSEHKTAPVTVDGYPMIRTPNVGAGQFLLDGVLRVSERTYRTWTRRAVPREGDLILAREAPVGNVALVPPGLNPVLGQRTVLIRPNRNLVFPQFLQYLLLGPAVQHRMWSLANGATVPHLNMEDIRALVLPELPSVETQRKIGAVLAAYDELIENNQRRIEVAEEMAQAIYREWFVKLRYPGDSSHDGWPEFLLSELSTTQYGYTASTSEVPVGPQFLRGMDFNKRPWVDWSQVPYCEVAPHLQSKYRLHDLDILVIRMADPGKVAIVEGEHNAVFASYLVRVAPDLRRLEPYWLFYYLSSPEYQAYIGGAGTGTTRKSASAGVLTGSRLRIPPLQLQQAFVAMVSPLRTLLNNLLSQNANLRTTRDLLLPKLISGVIDVSDLDIDTDWLVA